MATMREIPRVSVRHDAAEAVEALKTAGAVILTDASDGGEIGGARAEIEGYLGRAPDCTGHFYGFKTKRCGALMAKSPTMARLCTHERVLQIMETVLGPACDRIQLNLTQAIEIGPGEKIQFLHRDDELFPFPHEGFETMVNVMWPLAPFSKENGGTRIIVGSHRWPRDRVPEVGEAVSAELAIGEALVYLGSTLHGGGANVSDAPRTGAVVSYNLGWLKQTENFFISVPWEVAQHLPEDLLRLMGYQMHRPNVGWVEGIDPLDYLRAKRPAVVGGRDYLNDEQTAMLAELTAEPEKFLPWLS